MNPPTWIDSAVALVKQSEGCELCAYPDPATRAEPWTIGYGATGRGITKGTVWTQTQAESDLLKRITDIGARIDALVKVALTANQKAAIADFVYNVGAPQFAASTLLRLLNAGDYAGAGNQFERWTLANGHVLPGLVKRRRAERALFLKPDA
jgi:lysozyme